MAQGKNITGLTDLLLKCMAEPDPMLSMLEWLCAQLMEAEVSGIVGAEKNVHSSSRNDYRCGYRPRRLDTRMDGRVISMAVLVPAASMCTGVEGTSRGTDDGGIQCWWFPTPIRG